jgi:thiamine-monophosphate kinase
VVKRPGEFELIERFARPFTRGEGVRIGIGDDAAVLRLPPGQDLVATVDAVVEGVHFTPSFGPEEIGWKALAVNLSDLAAMGARPLWALVALATPPAADPARLARVGRGIAACARRHGLSVVGGNVTAARQLSLTVTVLGAVRPGRALVRSGGRPGDLLVVSGTLGDAALGLLPGAAPGPRARQRRPRPRLELGRGAVGIARAAIDISDGLLQDLGHLCAACGVGARVEVERLPLSPAYRAATRGGRDPFEGALSGGEDYELLLAVPPSRLQALQRAARGARTRVTVVGVLEDRPGVRVVRGGRPFHPRRTGHDHLRAGRVLGPGRGRA